MAATGGTGVDDPADGDGAGTQLRLLSHHARADDDVDVLYFSLWILAHRRRRCGSFSDPANHWGALDAFFILSLLLAEAYAFFILFLGYFQTIWPLRRAPVPLPDATEEWPHVDVLIPTYNEPLDVVRYTALGALNMDWPADKMHVYILDDGRRKEFEQFAFEAGIGYKIRAATTSTPRRATSMPR